MTAILALADGTTFHGESIGVSGSITGEVVFNTAMIGYQEIITDPSYAKQIINFTYPHIGNTGINLIDNEAEKIFAAGIIVREHSLIASNWRKIITFANWLKGHKIIAISGVNTRLLMQHIREHGTQNGCIMAGIVDKRSAINQAKNCVNFTTSELLSLVTTTKTYLYGKQHYQSQMSKKVVVIDFGVKQSILASLANNNCAVVVVPAYMPAEEILQLRPDGIVLSNGPGDPDATIGILENISKLINSRAPILGICLGFQLLALAFGSKTFKLRFGHHGANHPVQDIVTGRVYITSQNHNYAIAETPMSDDLKITHRSLFDKTIQGIQHKYLPICGYQWHPEAGPGSHDSIGIFQQFVNMMQHKACYA